MKKLEEYSEVELKALAFEQLETIEMAQNNLKIINQERTKRNSLKAETKPDEKDNTDTAA